MTRGRQYAFVDLKYLFENFEYKKQLEKDFEKVIAYRRKEMDSLEYDYNQFGLSGGDNKQLEDKGNYLYNKKKEFQEANVALSQDFDKKIYKQLKQYIKEYAKIHDVELVIGEVEENLNVIGKGEDNINKEMLDFVNKKYNNK